MKRVSKGRALLEGMVSFLSFEPPRFRRKRRVVKSVKSVKPVVRVDDAEALAEDWKKVGQDIRCVLGER